MKSKRFGITIKDVDLNSSRVEFNRKGEGTGKRESRVEVIGKEVLRERLSRT